MFDRRLLLLSAVDREGVLEFVRERGGARDGPGGLMRERERERKRERDNLVWTAANCDREIKPLATVVIMKGKTKGLKAFN